jgi:hypothetical protein
MLNSIMPELEDSGLDLIIIVAVIALNNDALVPFDVSGVDWAKCVRKNHCY